MQYHKQSHVMLHGTRANSYWDRWTNLSDDPEIDKVVFLPGIVDSLKIVQTEKLVKGKTSGY